MEELPSPASSASSTPASAAAAGFSLHHRHRQTWWRWLLVCGLMLLFSLFCGLLLGISALVMSNIPHHHRYHPSRIIPQISIDCRIISAGIDLRSTRICEALDKGQLQSRFRCYFEYYWASVFKVEFKPHASELVIQTVTEVPREALPSHCRPGFAHVWMVKERHQVNETYPCKYSLGRLGTVEMSEDLFPHCRSEDISMVKLIKQACYMLFLSEQWIFSTASQFGVIFRSIVNYIFVVAVHSVLIVGFSKAVSKMRLMLVGPSQRGSMETARFESQCILITATLWGTWSINHLGDPNDNLVAAVWPFADLHRILFELWKTVKNGV